MSDRLSITEASRSYLSTGLCVLPARRAQKRPDVGSWKPYRKRLPTEAEVSAWMTNDPDAICIVCGAISGNLEIIDFDAGGECFDTWESLIPAELFNRVVIEQTPSGGFHVAYRCQQEICGNMKLAQRERGDQIVTLIETRGEGGLFLCAPTDGYELLQGEMAMPPVLSADERDVLLQAAWALNEYRPPVVDGPPMSAGSVENRHGPSDNGMVGQRSPLSDAQCGCPPENADRPGDDFNHRGDVRAVLEQFGWSRTKGGENEYWRRPGKDSGTSATLKDGVFYVFSSNADPFEPNQAYSPLAVYALLTHGGDFQQAASCLRQLGFGGDGPSDNADGVDISAIVGMSAAPGACPSDNGDNGQSPPGHSDKKADGSQSADPGPIPEHMLHIPGFIGEVVDFCLHAAPYPNLAMAFCGALALQSHLCARKVCEPGDLRTNLYLLALTGSSGGKNFPRHINTHVLTSIGEAKCLGDKFASGEGIQDELHRRQAKLYQNDEIDGLIQSVNKSRDGRFESVMATLLTMYTSANTIYPMRSKAGKDDAGIIDQPHLTIFGTATPTYYYEALSERMLTNGFFARMIIVDVGKRPEGQDPRPVGSMPQHIIDAARWWHELQPGAFQGNLSGFHPQPNVVPYSDDAQEAFREFRRQADIEYGLAEDRNDEVAKTVWGRANENARKLALLHACSANHESPLIDMDAATWAMAFVDHQVRRMLYMAGQYVSHGEFDAICKKLLRRLRETPNGRLEHSKLLKRTKVKARDFRDLIETLVQRGDVEVITTPTTGRPTIEYAVKEGVSCG